MITRKNRLMSFILANIMVLTMIFGIIPPLEVHAISPEEGGDGNLYISSPSQDDDINGYEDITIRWNRVSGAHHYWLTVKDTVKGTNLFNKNVGTKTSYTFSYDDDIFVTDGRVYKIYVAAMDSSGNVLNGAADWNAIYVTNYLELDYDIIVETIDTDGEQTMNTLEMCAELYIDSNVDIGSIQVGFEYGVKGGTQRKGTTVLRQDGDEFGWELTGLSAGTTYTYRGYAIDPVTGEYIYGDRITITTLDEEDFLPEVYTDSATDITLTSAVINGELEFTADLSTEYGFILGTGVTEQVKIGTSTSEKSFEYEWDYLQPNTQYTYKTYAKNKYGTVYGNTKTFTTKSDTTKPVIEVLESSLGNEFTYGSTVTFTAEASDNVALSEFILYVDNTKVKYSDYYTDYNELEYTTSTLSAGTHTIKAYAVDDGGNEATKTITITVTEPVGTGILGDVNSDGQVTNLDRFVLNRYLNSMSGYTTNMVNKYSADIDGDGSLTEDDSIILARHLFGWIGYEDLSAFYVGPTETPVTDTSKWNVTFSMNTVRIEVTKVSGEIDSSKKYLFVAEDSDGLHYIGYINAGKTSASFNIKDLQMSRGETYSYYVLPEGIVLANNKDKYFISECAVPLYNGMMITSVKNDGRKVYTGGDMYVDSDIIINWDGSYGVNNFTLNVLVNGTSVYKTTYNHDGPGTATIDSSILSVGDVKIIGTVKAPTGSGLSDATSIWTGKIINRPSEPVDTTGYINELNDLFMNYDTNFETLTECAKDEFDAYWSNEFSTYASTVVADIVNLSDVVDILTNGDPDVTYAKRAIGRLIETMDDEYYGGVASECIDVTAALINYFENTEVGAIKSMFEGTHHLDAILAVKTDLDARRLDNINNQLSLYIEKLFEYGFEEDIIMEKYAEIYSYQTANMSKSSALKKVSKVAGTFGKGLGALIDCMDKLDVFLKVKSVVWDPFFVDYSVDIVKLDIIIAALEECGWEKILTAAKRLKLEMENQLAKAAANAIIVGTDMVVEGLTGGAWAIVSAPLSLTIADSAESVRDFGYICEIEYALYNHINNLAYEYLEDADSHYLMQIKKDLHALTDCRALMNSMAISINKITILFFEVWRDDITTTLETYRYYYAHRHAAIEELFG